jgi:NAD(P)-dependent dehydrogenase (short-subunit alcohol dehydrogenase family)
MLAISSLKIWSIIVNHWILTSTLKHMKDGARINVIGLTVGQRVVVPGLVPYAATKGAVRLGGGV